MSEWTAVRHAAAKARYAPPANDSYTSEATRYDYHIIRDALAEIERLQAFISGGTETSLERQVEELRHTLKLRNNYIEDREAVIEHQDKKITALKYELSLDSPYPLPKPKHMIQSDPCESSSTK